MEDAEGERGANGHSCHFCPKCQSLEISGEKTHLLSFSVGPCCDLWLSYMGPSVKSDGKLILTGFQIIWGSEVLPRFMRGKKMICFMKLWLLITVFIAILYPNCLLWLFTAADIQWERALDWPGIVSLNVTSLQKWWNVGQQSWRKKHSVQLMFRKSGLWGWSAFTAVCCTDGCHDNTQDN